MDSISETKIIKIAVIGPESTGKSTLSAELAAHYKSAWCPEYARGYLLEHGMGYTYDDLLTIAKGQAASEDKCVSKATTEHHIGDAYPLIIDTEMYVMKVWCEFVFNNCHLWILDQIAQRNYHLYLLCDTDLPWVKDELREYPDLENRAKLFAIYKDIMINQSVPWKIISGETGKRLQSAIAAVDEIL
ncbi:MAG: ATP-binding protein [Chitinophagaceae bacterium]|nr:ATP-binding protein [Chitinophagaceae bacterium]